MFKCDLIDHQTFIQAVLDLALARYLQPAFGRSIPRMKAITGTRYQSIAAQTSLYSPAYLGQLKPSGTVRAGAPDDPGYSIDTAALYSDLTDRGWLIAGNDIEIVSDQAYAAYQQTLLQRKLDGADWFPDDPLMAILEGSAGFEADEAWDE